MYGSQALANLMHEHSNNTALAAQAGAAPLLVSLIQQVVYVCACLREKGKKEIA